MKTSRTFRATAGASINEMQIVLPARERWSGALSRLFILKVKTLKRKTHSDRKLSL